MPSLFFVLKDQALVSALVEQVNDFGWDKPLLPATLSEALLYEDSGVIVIDDEATLELPRKGELPTTNKRIILISNSSASSQAVQISEIIRTPFRLGSFMIRLDFQRMMARKPQNRSYQLESFRFDPFSRQLVNLSSNEIQKLTEKETSLLEFLWQSDEPVTRSELLEAVWGYGSQVDTHTLETHIYQLRRKLTLKGEEGNCLINENGKYSLRRGV